MPAEDYGPKLIINTQTDEQTLVPLTIEEVAERDTLSDIAQQETLINNTRTTNKDLAVQELRNLWNQSAFQSNVKQKTQSEIRTWIESLTAIQQADVLADSIWATRNMMLLLSNILDALDEGG